MKLTKSCWDLLLPTAPHQQLRQDCQCTESLPAKIHILSFEWAGYSDWMCQDDGMSLTKWRTIPSSTRLSNAFTRVLAGKGLSGMKPLSASRVFDFNDWLIVSASFNQLESPWAVPHSRSWVIASPLMSQASHSGVGFVWVVPRAVSWCLKFRTDNRTPVFLSLSCLDCASCASAVSLPVHGMFEAFGMETLTDRSYATSLRWICTIIDRCNCNLWVGPRPRWILVLLISPCWQSRRRCLVPTPASPLVLDDSPRAE